MNSSVLSSAFCACAIACLVPESAAAPQQTAHELPSDRQLIIVTPETALSFVEVLPGGQLKWGELRESPTGWGQDISTDKTTGQVIFSSEFLYKEGSVLRAKRIYFDITAALPVYRQALAAHFRQRSAGLVHLRQLLSNVRDKESADRLAADIKSHARFLRQSPESAPIPVAIYYLLLQEHDIDAQVEKIKAECSRLAAERNYESNALFMVILDMWSAAD